MPGIAAIVLAAGGSTRMGRPKQLIQINGESLIDRAARIAIDSNFDPIVIVLGSDAQTISRELSDLKIDCVVNEAWKTGIGSSIRRGVDRVLSIAPRIDAIAILLCDQPRITSQKLRKMHEHFVRGGKPVCVSKFGDSIGPPVIVGREFFDALQTLPDAAGAKSVWENHPESVCEFKCEEASFDLDTPADLDRLRRDV